MPLILIHSIAALYGLIIGSFANVMIYRIPLRMSLVNPARSACTTPGCGKTIAWYDNIPVLSWVCLSGRCRYCRNRISIIYPMIELLHGVAAVLCVEHFGLSATALLAFTFCSLLLVITVIDLQHMIIPNVINKPGMAAGVIVGAINEFHPLFAFPFSPSIVASIIGLLIGYYSLFIVAWLYTKAFGISPLGGGDIKFMGFVGALFGPQAILPTILGGSLLGILGAAAAIIKNKGNLRTEFPFGPWLALGIGLYLFDIDATEMIHRLLAYLV